MSEQSLSEAYYPKKNLVIKRQLTVDDFFLCDFKDTAGNLLFISASYSVAISLAGYGRLNIGITVAISKFPTKLTCSFLAFDAVEGF